MLRIYAAGLLMTVIQLWIALRFTSFVPGLAFGIGEGTKAQIACTRKTTRAPLAVSQST